MKFKETGSACLKRWDEWLVEELTGWINPPYDLVIVEDYARVFASGIINHKILGLIELACFKRDIRLIKVPIDTLKLYATGDGHASKDQMIASAAHYSGEAWNAIRIGDTIGNDEADAFWLGRIGYNIANDIRDEDGIRHKILDTLARTPDQVKADKRDAQLAKAAATIAADEAKKTKALVAQLRSEARAQRQAEVLRKREEKAARMAAKKVKI